MIKRLLPFIAVLFTLVGCEMMSDSDYLELNRSDNSFVFGAEGGTGEFSYTLCTDIDTEVLVSASDDWISITEHSDCRISFSVAFNDSGDEREGIIKLTYGPDVDEMLIQQLPEMNVPEECIIRYTTYDGLPVRMNEVYYDAVSISFDAFGAELISNAYVNGNVGQESQGMLIFNSPVEHIGSSVFSDSNLTTIEIPQTVRYIGMNAFQGSYMLERVEMPEAGALYEIGDWAFSNCTALRELTISMGVEYLGDGIVQNCSSLESFYGAFVGEDGRSLVVDGTLKGIAPAGLTRYSIPEGVTAIGDSALRGCGELTSITIPESVVEIGESAFSHCQNLEWFEGKFAADGGRALIDGDIFIAIAPAGLTSYTIPAGVTEIAAGAFSGVDNSTLDPYWLTEIILPEGLKTIGDHAFFGFMGDEIVIPEGVSYIGWQAFSFSNLVSVTLPASTETISGIAFWCCGNLESVHCKALTPPYLDNYYGDGVFGNNAPNRKIYVPEESLDLYLEIDGWSDYAADIVGE